MSWQNSCVDPGSSTIAGEGLPPHTTAQPFPSGLNKHWPPRCCVFFWVGGCVHGVTLHPSPPTQHTRPWSRGQERSPKENMSENNRRKNFGRETNAQTRWAMTRNPLCAKKKIGKRARRRETRRHLKNAHRCESNSGTQAQLWLYHLQRIRLKSDFYSKLAWRIFMCRY